MRQFIFGFLLATALLATAWLFTQEQVPPQERVQKQTQKYQCPMHPQFISDKPGDCAICGMKLVPIDPKPDHSAHPQASTASTNAPEGYSSLKLPAEKVQLMGVTTTKVTEASLERNIRTTGRVVVDETRIHHVHTKFEGYIEQIYVNYVGQFVKKGDPLFSVYSPELLATQREYLIALKARESSQTGGGPLSGVDLVESARLRLSLWDIAPAQIKQLEKTRQPQKAVIVRAPVSGFVTAKTALHGTRIMPSDALYDIVDLSHVWVIADIYEVQAPQVEIGTPAVVEMPYDNTTRQGKIMYIDPVLDSETRTIRARIELSNPGNTLKPDMFANVILGGTAATGLMIPDSAVVSTGERNIVFVAKGNGVFEPREIVTGVKVRNFYQVKSGLYPGEHVVTSGNFLLDSESRLRAAANPAEHKH